MTLPRLSGSWSVQKTCRRAAGILSGLALVVTTASACSSDAPASPAPGAEPPQAEGQASRTGDIRHLEPRPDFVGPQPERFSWSTVEGADTYTLRIWNESDVRVLSETGLNTTTVEFPKEHDLPAGTYFWAIVGMRGEQAIAESGLAAFVVQKP